MERDHWIPADEWPHLIRRVNKAQADMDELALPFDEGTRDLNVLIRLTVEFEYYLRSNRSAAPYTERFVRNYVCDSILGGVDTFVRATSRSSRLIEAIPSRVAWDRMASLSASSFNQEFSATYHEFTTETGFGSKCRLLLDLYKLQIIFAVASYA